MSEKMNPIDPIEIAKEKMNKTLSVLQSEFAAIRAGRANAKLLDRIMVDYYGAPTPISQMANISSPEPRVLAISLWDASALKNVEKAIQKSDLGINPSNDGKIIRLVFPELTQERRQDLVKQIRKMSEEAKVAIRNMRRDANDALAKQQKNNELTEDDLKKATKDVQTLTDEKIKELEAIQEAKEKEILSI